MIPDIFVESWRKNTPWRMTDQIEQDLIISRALVAMYKDEIIQENLLFRGGTALNKLFIVPPSRYSEDIDFVLKNPGPIGPTIDAIKKVFKPWLGDPRWKITERSAKLLYRYQSVSNLPVQLKIEINVTEHFHVLPFKIVPYSVTNEWFTGSADIVTYEIDELMATKLRALYQRRKGRDLFDMWYVTNRNLINLSRVFDMFHQYCAYNGVRITRKEFLKNLELKKNHRDFHIDMSLLLPSKMNWNFEEAYQYVVEHVIQKMP